MKKLCILAAVSLFALAGCKGAQKSKDQGKTDKAAKAEPKTAPGTEARREAPPREAPRPAAPKVEPKDKLSEVTTDDIEAAAKAIGWKYRQTGGMEMGSQINSTLTFEKGSQKMEVKFVRPSGKPDKPNSSVKPMPVADQAKQYKGAYILHSNSLLGVTLGQDKPAAEALLKTLAGALLKTAPDPVKTDDKPDAKKGDKKGDKKDDKKDDKKSKGGKAAAKPRK